MFKVLLLCLCLGGALGWPVQSFEPFDDVENEAQIVEAASPLPGSRNNAEKRIPVIRLTIPGGYLGLHGTNNLRERPQLPPARQSAPLPGIRNLEEKALPEAALRGWPAARHPKSEVEKVVP